MNEKKYVEYVTVPKYTCFRCGHSWVTDFPREPLVCPKCKSQTWNVEKPIRGRPWHKEKKLDSV